MSEPADLLLDLQDWNGDRVILTREQWQRHVLTAKPFMADHLDDVRTTIMTPNYVNANADPDHPNRLCFYGRYTSRNPRLLIKLVIDYSGGTGFMVTAYPCSRARSGEVRIWTRQVS